MLQKGNNIRRFRKLLGLTQEKFAAWTEISTGLTFTETKQKAYELGRTAPDPIYMDWISRITFSDIGIWETELSNETLLALSKKVQKVPRGTKKKFPKTVHSEGEDKISFEKTELIDLFTKLADASNQKAEKILKEQNLFLQDLVKTNLTTIEKWSFATLIDLQASIHYQARKESAGDEQKAKAILQEQGKIAGDLRKTRLKAGKSLDVDI